jgi:hypothetical protein
VDLRTFDLIIHKRLFWINRAFLLIGVKGGSSYPWAYCNKDAMILHKRGRETEFSYEFGFYRYLSNPPLELKVVDNDQVFIEKLFERLGAQQF